MASGARLRPPRSGGLSTFNQQVLLVSRLVDLDPSLVLRTFVSNALAVSAPDADDARALALPPAEYVREGQLTIGYLSGVPAGHVTYDLVGHMLGFHRDPRLRVLWFTAAADATKIKKGSKDEGGIKGQANSADAPIRGVGGLPASAAAGVIRAERLAVLVDLDGWDDLA